MVGSQGYTCNHFKSLDDKCGFLIYHSYFEKEITAEIAIQLIENGQTNVFNDLVSQKGNTFSAKLSIINGSIAPIFEEKYLQTPCPLCQDRLLVTANGFACENYFQDAECSFYLSKNIAGYCLSEVQAEIILNGAKTDFIEDFSSSRNTKFGAKVFLNEEVNGEGETFFNTKFDFSLASCPKCSDGNILVNDKAFGCSNWKNQSVKCDFTVWRNISGKHITVKIFQELLKNGQTRVFTDFRKKNGEKCSGKLVFTEDFKAKVV